VYAVKEKEKLLVGLNGFIKMWHKLIMIWLF